MLPQDVAKAICYLLLAADQGPSSQGPRLEPLSTPNRLGLVSQLAAGRSPMRLSEGKGVAKDLGEAVRLYALAADKGHLGAQNNLATCFLLGEGVPQDYAKAAHNFILAADQGMAVAQFNAGQSYHLGRGRPQDDAKAARYFRLAADQGMADGQYLYASCLHHDWGIPEDDTQAARYFRLAADQSHVKAQFRLSVCLLVGVGVPQHVGDVPENHSMVARYFLLAADQGESGAQLDIARYYHEGKGVPKEDAKAIRYLRLAADQGFAEAQYSYVLLYREGRGVPQNHSMAARYFLHAADQGHVAAQHDFARYYYGSIKGLSQDVVKAIHYCHLAADQGLAVAQCDLAQSYSHGEGPLPQDYNECIRYHRLAADQGFAQSMLALGAMLIDNEHVPADVRACEPADSRAGAKLLARAAQSMEPRRTAERLQALELLCRHADLREVVSVCCIGCSKTEGLKQCTRCHEEEDEEEEEEDLASLPIRELKGRLDRLKISYAGVLERFELGASAEASQSGRADSTALDAHSLGRRPGAAPVRLQHPPAPAEQRPAASNAVRLYTLAADKGNLGAQNNHAELYHHGAEGVPRDDAKAAHYFILAADQGLAASQFNAGQYYRRVKSQDNTKAAHYFRLAADQGIAGGQYFYAMVCRDGKGGHAEAQFYRGITHMLGDGPIRASQRPSQCDLAQSYSHGEGPLRRDYGECIRYHRNAADQGFALSMVALGAMLIDDEHAGDGVRAREPADPRAGAKLIGRAAQSMVEPHFAPKRRQALELLRSHADLREVVSAYCIGCGKTKGLKQCTRCHEEEEEDEEEEEEEDLASLPIRELKGRLYLLKISYAGVLERSELVALLENATG
ncbi:hypothetical protein T492DRAFT_907374 [Pavlovales sp. CCMP2436]|nr:hypothetical protein T492DRAFT_907374 [Pavlovales sp. CCMP2436]